ncbi:ricin-type beta-trefoil lectin domain protein [Streptomyces mirabilis]|uniref:ricin-type beta-trefoil lectin domain protein n=1 Tax=Streptomyces mirabilis TaxID=68239 RepID=UPI0036DF0888
MTAASDIFALASAIAYAVTGQAPFGEGTGVDVLHRVAFEPPKEEVLEKAAAVDTELAAFIRTCLDKEPESRPSPETVFRTAIGHQFPAPAERPSRSAPKKAPLPDVRPAARPRPPADPPAGSVASDHPVTPAPGRRRKLIVGAAATVGVAVATAVTVALLPQSHSSATAAPGPDTSATRTDNPASTPSSSQKAPMSSPSQADQSAKQSPSAAATKDPTTQGSGTPDLRTAECSAELASGTTGACVKALQLLLDGHGLYVPVSGDFDAPTVAVVRAFQTEAGLTVDGKAGAQTKKLLYALSRGTVQAGSVTVTESVNAASVARCLDNRGSDVQVWGCNGTDAQNWALYRVAGQGSRYRVVNRGSHLCLDADTGTTGQKIQATSCDGLSTQTWQLGGSGTLVSVPDGFCLDAEASTSGQDGQRVQGWGCASSVNQVWHWS